MDFKKSKKKNKILDVGCGNGSLAMFLRTPNNRVIGIDPSLSIEKAKELNTYNNVEFIQTSFESFNSSEVKYDAIIFVASIHHMNMRDSLVKAKELLSKGGILIIVGIAKPSNFLDWLVEAIRVVPNAVISFIKKNTTSEDLDINVSYAFPSMNEVRRICTDTLPGYKLKYGLHYRYLLTWNKN